MSPHLIGIFGFILMLMLILVRVHLGVAMGMVGLAGALVLIGPTAFGFAITTPFGTFGLEQAVLPLFILMGMLAAESGISAALFDSAQKWLSRIRGGLLIATTLSIGIFGACCGSSIAAATTFTKIAMPELLKNKFDPGISGGAIAAGGTQASLIPPSAMLVFYGILTEQSVGKLLLAGLIPGAISILIYMLTVWITLTIFPHKAPQKTSFTLKEKVYSLKGVWPIPLIFISIIGGMFLGVFTPSEAGAVGAILTLITSVISNGWRRAQVPKALVNSVSTSAMIFFILISAMIFIRFIALTQLPNMVGGFIETLPLSPIMILIVILFIYVILGCFLDAVGMIALTIPIVFPIIEMLGINGIWFGILMVKVVEIGLITPPIGINVFVVKGAAGDQVSTAQLFRGIIPFLIADIVTLAILLAFPIITLIIPNFMK